ncbi:MAG: glycosyltransferase family 2 protein [Clostridiaceae bacterium]|nr:glycosyltransferase family 2 protein [Clostridiaceae bacterium]
MEELVSVIVPCYNQARYLPEALQSVLNQTYDKWECFIINDGSSDNTEEAALKWVNKDTRFKYIKISHSGPSASRNVALKIVSGEFLQLLDADDVIDPRKFEIQIKSLADTPKYSLSICDYFSSSEYDLLKQHNRYLTPRFKSSEHIFELISDWQTKLSIPPHCFLIKSSLFRDKQIFLNETLPNHVDWEFWMNIFKLKPIVKFVDLKLATYRIHDHGICGNKKLMKIGYLQAINIQRSKYNTETKENELLTRKYNQIKYGSDDKNVVLAFVKGFLMKYSRKLLKIEKLIYDQFIFLFKR